MVGSGKHCKKGRTLGALAVSVTQGQEGEEVGGGVGGFDGKDFELSGKEVVSPDGDDGDEKTKGCGDKRSTNSAHNQAHQGVFFHGPTGEGIQDAVHSAKKADQRGRRCDGGEGRKAILETALHPARSTVERASSDGNGFHMR